MDKMPKDNDEKYGKWKANITFVPFESEEQKKEAYRIWVKLFLKLWEREK